MVSWSCLVLLPFGRTVEVPVLAMAAAGIYLLVRHGKRLLAHGPLRIFTAVFLLAWVPVLISLFDAVNSERTLVVVVNHLRFYFAGVFMLHTLGEPTAQRRFLALSGWLLGFWVLDALLQLAVGYDLLGRGPSELGLSGLFGPDGKHFGMFMALLSPLLWEYGRRHWPWWVLVPAVIATVFVIISGGTRAAWVVMLCIIATFTFLFWFRRRVLPWNSVSLVLVSGLIVGAIGYNVSQPFRHRADQTLQELKSPFETGNLGHRAWIWRGGWNMFLAHPLNGVGARGFRYAFADYADENDPFLARDPPVIPTHSHHMIMEVATETGLIGLAGLVGLVFLLARLGWRAAPQTQRYMLPYALVLAAAYFPLNTHWAIYGAHLSQILWFMIALYLAAYAAGAAQASVSSEDAAESQAAT